MSNNDFLSLPVYKYQIDIGNSIRNNNKLIVIGETGSGKTTQVPKIILNSLGYIPNSFSSNSEKIIKICITQPRRVAAISVATRVSQELNVKLGSTVGYSVRFDERSSSNTQLKYVTDGMLLREAILDNKLSNYDVIIIDEIHERSINTDTLLALIMNIQKYRKELKLVVMSATIELEKLKKYLLTENHITIEGRSFPIEVYHVIEPQSNYLDAACTSIMQIHLMEMKNTGDILVFLPGQEDIEDLGVLLEGKNKIMGIDKNKYPKQLQVFYLFSNLPNTEQMKVFQKINSSLYRKVILSTNIAETSLTIKDVKFVVDSGMYKTRIYDVNQDLDKLVLDKINKNSAIQRTGRAGREAEGKCFRLFTEEEYNKMNDNPIPEILRSKLHNLIVLLKSIGNNNIFDLHFIDYPSKEVVTKSLDELKRLGVITNKETLTELGRNLSILPLDPIYGIILLNAYMNDEYKVVQDDVLTIISLLQVDNIFFTSQQNKEKAEISYEKFSIKTSDHLTLLNIYKQWREVKEDKLIKTDKWIKDNCLNEKSLLKAEEIKNQMERYLVSIVKEGKDKVLENRLDAFLIEKSNFLEKDKIELNEIKNSLIIKCLCTGYVFNLAKHDSDNVFLTNKGKHYCRVHPTSVISKNLKLAKEKGYLIYNEIVFTSKQYLKICSVVGREIVDRFNMK